MGAAVETAPAAVKDFFISYNHADEAWAEWIAWQLEERLGYQVEIQAWDSRPGEVFPHKMKTAIETSQAIVPVLSPGYLRSDYTHPEWYEFFSRDPNGELRLIRPVLVKPGGEALPLLGTRIFTDLVGKSEEEAQEALCKAFSEGRARPETSPPFPGAATTLREIPFPGRHAGIRHLPWARNENFRGYESVLEELEASLNRGVGRIQLTGLPGVGKTSVALEMAYRMESNLDLLWWIDGSDSLALEEDIQALKGQAGIEDLRQDLRNRGRWLIIFDSVESLEEIEEILPIVDGGLSLVTSNRRDPRLEEISIDGLDVATAMELLCVRAAREVDLSDVGSSEVEEVELLVNELERLPIAIEQAALFIRRSGMEIGEYLDLLRSEPEDALSGTAPLDYRRGLVSVWRLRLERIGEENPPLKVWLECMSWLPSVVSRDLSQAIARVLVESSESKFQIESLLAEGCDTCAVRVEDGGTMSFHGLLHRLTRRLWMRSVESRAEWESLEPLSAVTMGLLEYGRELLDAPTREPAERHFLQAVQEFQFCLEEIGWEDRWPTKTTDLLQVAGDVAHQSEEWSLARKWHERVLLDSVGLTHEERVDLLLDLSEASMEEGLLEKAEVFLDRLEQAEQQRPFRKPETEAILAYRRGELAEMHQDWDRARQRFESALALDREISDVEAQKADHEALARVFESLGRSETAAEHSSAAQRLG